MFRQTVYNKLLYRQDDEATPVYVYYTYVKGCPATYHPAYGWSPPDPPEAEFVRAYTITGDVIVPTDSELSGWLETILDEHTEPERDDV